MPTADESNQPGNDLERLESDRFASGRPAGKAPDLAKEVLGTAKKREGVDLPNDPDLLLTITGVTGRFSLGTDYGGFYTRGLGGDKETDPVTAEQLEKMLAENDPRLKNGIYVVPSLGVIDDTLIPLGLVSHGLTINGVTTPLTEIDRGTRYGYREVPYAVEVNPDTLPDYFRIREARAKMIEDWEATSPPMSETVTERDLIALVDLGFQTKNFEGLYLDRKDNTVSIEIDGLERLPIGLRVRPETRPYQFGTIVENSPTVRVELREQGIHRAKFEVKPEVIEATLAHWEEKAEEMRNSFSYKASKAWRGVRDSVVGFIDRFRWG